MTAAAVRHAGLRWHVVTVAFVVASALVARRAARASGASGRGALAVAALGLAVLAAAAVMPVRA